MTTRIIPILDPGHGGISPGGIYLTPGKRSPFVPPGIYEGTFNRAVCEHAHWMLRESGYEPVILAPGPVDVPDVARRNYVRSLVKAGAKCVVVSVHANAEAVPAGKWGAAHGATVFHWKPWIGKPSGDSVSLANMLLNEISDRADLDIRRGVRSARFTVLNVPCPAALIECGFMTNLLDAVDLADTDTQRQISVAIHNVITRFEEGER